MCVQVEAPPALKSCQLKRSQPRQKRSDGPERRLVDDGVEVVVLQEHHPPLRQTERTFALAGRVPKHNRADEARRLLKVLTPLSTVVLTSRDIAPVSPLTMAVLS